MIKVYCVFGDFLSKMDIEKCFVRSGAEVMLLGQYFSAEYLRQEAGERQYQLWTRAEVDIKKLSGIRLGISHSNIRASFWDGVEMRQIDIGPVLENHFASWLSPLDIRQQLEEIFPGAKFECWENFLKGVAV